jgi:hypothetical protein
MKECVVVLLQLFKNLVGQVLVSSVNAAMENYVIIQEHQTRPNVAVVNGQAAPRHAALLSFIALTTEHVSGMP